MAADVAFSWRHWYLVAIPALDLLYPTIQTDYDWPLAHRILLRRKEKEKERAARRKCFFDAGIFAVETPAAGFLPSSAVRMNFILFFFPAGELLIVKSRQ